jgi:hypothetical protein
LGELIKPHNNGNIELDEYKVNSIEENSISDNWSHNRLFPSKIILSKMGHIKGAAFGKTRST